MLCCLYKKNVVMGRWRNLAIFSVLVIGLGYLSVIYQYYNNSIDAAQKQINEDLEQPDGLYNPQVSVRGVSVNQNSSAEDLEEVSIWIDGAQMNDQRIDDVVYFKRNGRYYKRIFEGPVKAEWFGAVGDGIKDDTEALQKLLDSDYPNISLEKGKTYLVSKNFSLEGFPNNDQPCLLIIHKNNMVFDGNGATLIVKEHAQGILEVQKSKNIIVKNLNVIGAGNFPPIDGQTGYGEKGVNGKGYYTSGFWGYYKNNSKNTSNEYRGGFNSKFQQYQKRGTTGSTWGKWNGGFIGNVSYGILIHNGCEEVVLDNCKAEKFNYVGLGVGHNGNLYPKDLNYQSSKGIVFQNCESNHNYSAGFHSMDVDGFKLVNSSARNSGHPDASLKHETSNPGYGYTARGSSKYTRNALIENSTFKSNKRKGLDIHAGRSIVFKNNYVFNSNICGIYAAWTDMSQPAIDISVLGNQIEDCGKGKGSLGAIYLGANANSKETEKYLNALVSGNQISNYSGSAIRVRYGNTVVVSNNRIGNSIKGYGANLSAILVVGQNENSLAHSVDVYNNQIKDESGNILRGIQVSNAREVNVEGNEIVFKADVDNALMVRGGSSIYVQDNIISLSGKGNIEAIPQASRSKKKNRTNAQRLIGN